jgi:hypothetical protein
MKMAKAELNAGMYQGQPGGMAVAMRSPVRTALPSLSVHFLLIPDTMDSDPMAERIEMIQTQSAAEPYNEEDQTTMGKSVNELIQTVFALVRQSWMYGG